MRSLTPPLALLLALGCLPAAEAFTPKPLTPQTLAERFPDAPFATLIDAPPVALKAGGSLPISAQVCAGCHPDHQRDWAASTHAHALADPQFIAELSKPSSPRWLCLNCHIPLQQQRSYRVQADSVVRANGWDVRALEKVPNPDHDPSLTQEAITCATCHVRRDTDGKGVIIGPRGSAAAPHRVRTDPAALQNICARCHDPGPVQLTGTFLCWFETRREIAKGSRKGAQCVECHMPVEQRAPAVGRPVRAVRAHHWRGGGPGKTYQSPLGQSALEVTTTVEPDAFVITLKNAHAAHRAPTADPERHFRVIVEQGDERTVRRIGQTWDWGDANAGRAAHKVSDDRPYAGESRQLRIPRRPGPAQIRVLHVRLSVANLEHMKRTVVGTALIALAPAAAAQIPTLQRHYPLFRTVYRAQFDGATVTVHPKPQAKDAAAAQLDEAGLRRLMGE